MTLPLIAFLVAAIIPIFFGKIRSAPFWLTAQAAALAWNVAQHGDPSLHTYVALAEVLVVTGVLMLTGSLNVMGVWLLENVPVLGRIEELVTPERLQKEILKEGMGK